MSAVPARLVQPARRRAIALIRVSRERDGMTSPEVQRHAIDAFADSNGIEIVRYVEGIDESGSRASSAWWARLDTAIGAVESGEADGVLVWKFSRVGRQRLRWAVALDRMDTIGGFLLSATEPVDSHTASGRFSRGMLGEMNAYQSELLGEQWKETHARRVREGKPANGRPRFGYVYDRESGFTPDPVTGPILAETYRRYIGGESMYSLVAWLNDGPSHPVTGYGPPGDGLWSAVTLRRVLDSGFAAGLITHQGVHHPGVHEPLITPEQWDAFLEARGRRRVYRRTERSEYLFSGMLWCFCGAKMHAGLFGSSRTAKYRCKDAGAKRKHTGGYVTERHLENVVREWLIDHNSRIRAELAEVIAQRPSAPPTADPREKLLAELQRVRTKRDRLVEDSLLIEVPRDTYTRLLAKFRAEEDALEAELRTHEVRRAAPIRVLPTLLERWDDLGIPEKREMLRAIIERIDVTPQRPSSKIVITARG